MKKLSIKSQIKLHLEYFRYLIIGVTSNVLSYGIFYTLTFCGLTVGVSSAVGMVCGILNTYTLGRKYIREEEVAHTNTRLLVFFIYYVLAVFFTSWMIESLSTSQHFAPTIAWLICNILISICNFAFIRFVSLRT